MAVSLCRASLLVLSALLGQLLFAAEVPANSVPQINFQRQIRPILSDNCFLCHGPDQGTRMADLRLDIKEGAFATRKNGAVIVPGKPDESLLIKRVFSDKAAFRMPPVFSHKTLTDAQKQTLRTWVEQGANWTEHWAFIPPRKPQPPVVKDAGWPKNPIDQFVLAKLESVNLTPAPEADRHTLIRRVTLDLTGLPPTPTEVTAFLNDQSPDAYEKVVDRLLASPRYGEHRARYWLDAARYADTQGLHIDNYREMWPYRDWVINAFNRNLPFDEFTREQIAGDLLPNSTLNQKIASGFQRCNVTTNEEGVIPDEIKAIYAKDRADTTGMVWMGLTVGCATCHDHKFDPISQKDFYSLTAFFRNTTQEPMDGNVLDTPPTVVVPKAEDRDRWQQLNSERQKALATLNEAKSTDSPGFDRWLKSKSLARPEREIKPSSVLLDVAIADQLDVLQKGKRNPVNLPQGVTISPATNETGPSIHFTKDSSVTLPPVTLDTDRPFTISTRFYFPKPQEGQEKFVIASQTEKIPKEGSQEEGLRGWVLNVGKKGPELRLFGSDRKYLSAWAGRYYELKPEAWYSVIFTYDGSRDHKGLELFVNGLRVPIYGDGLDVGWLSLQSSIRTASPVELGRQDKAGYPGGAIAEFRVFDFAADEQTAELLSLRGPVKLASTKKPADLSPSERTALRTWYVYERSAELRPVIAQLHKINAERTAIVQRGSTTFVMHEQSDSKPVAHVLYRGQYDQMKDEVPANTPAVLPPMKSTFPKNRLGLAEWIVDSSNPLTSRVTVNRFWQEVFGTGIVKTAEDFGSQGEPASHPELLDWLAVDFRDSGWDTKKFFRLMVTSATYRQSAQATATKLQKDPDDRFLSRGPRFRMDGEMVRDYALAASGLMTPTIGGPSVKPYQPPNIWEAVAMDVSNTRFYKADSGDKLYRRSLYTYWKRSAPPPSMDIFNAPSRESCTVRRERTDTPLQSLVTMNDPQFVEAARSLAQNALESSTTDVNAQLNYMSTRLLAREFDQKEQNLVLKSYQDYLAYYQGKPDDATKLLSVGESPTDPKLPKPQLAAMTMVANEIFNLDEVLTK